MVCGRLTTVMLAMAAPALGVTAQAPVTPPINPPPQQPAPSPPPAPPPAEPANAPVDEAGAAAELLRRQLGLEPGPQGPPPAGPPGQPLPQQEPKPVDPTDAARQALERGQAGEGAQQTTPPPKLIEPTGLALSGVFSTGYRLRHGAGSTDQDLIARLTVDVGRVDRDAVTAHVSARGYADLDGTRPDDPFAGLDESLGNNVNGRLYGAHVDAHRIPHVELARLGRQDLEDAPVFVTFDGVRADSERFGAMRAWMSAYGGVPVHYFEASASGDSVYGAAGGLSPWANTRIRFDWIDLRDEWLATDRHDSLVGVKCWQNVGAVQLTGLYTWLDGDPRDLQLGARGDLDVPLHFDCHYRELLTTQRAQVTELDPFFDIALEYFPYREVDVSLGTDIGSMLVIDVGVDVRRLDDQSDERAFNREFERWFTDVTLLDLFTRGLSLTVSGSRWDSSGEGFETVAGDLEYRPDNKLRVTLGTAYDLFKYDALANDERVHVRSWYLRIDRRLTDAVRVDGGYAYERNDDDEFHVFRLEVTWTF